MFLVLRIVYWQPFGVLALYIAPNRRVGGSHTIHHILIGYISITGSKTVLPSLPLPSLLPYLSAKFLSI